MTGDSCTRDDARGQEGRATWRPSASRVQRGLRLRRMRVRPCTRDDAYLGERPPEAVRCQSRVQETRHDRRFLHPR